MTDTVDHTTRSRMMSRIRGKDTRPEYAVRRGLHRNGYRFRLHSDGLPGRPDLVLPRFGAVVFVHGCFWHRHANCRYATTPSTRVPFWQEKFHRTVERDKANEERLLAAGWRVFVVWECGIRHDESSVIEDLCVKLKKAASPSRIEVPPRPVRLQ